MTKTIRLFAIFLIFFLFANCAEFFSKKEDNKNSELLASLLLLNGSSCSKTGINSQPTNGTAYDFSSCTGSATSALASVGFTGSNVSLQSGIVGTDVTSTMFTNASSLSSSGTEKKATIEITYVMTDANATLDIIMPSTTGFAGSTFEISPTGIKKKNSLGVSSGLAEGTSIWTSSLNMSKTLCLEVHNENGAHMFGWSKSCANVERGTYEFQEEAVSGYDFSGDRIAFKINKATIKSLNIYSAVIGTTGSIRF